MAMSMRPTMTERVVAGVGHVGEEFAHLRGRLHVELVGHELQPALVGDGLAGADAEQHVVRLRVAAPEIVRVVGRDQGQASTRARA
jgi:isochorismate hydrolase